MWSPFPANFTEDLEEEGSLESPHEGPHGPRFRPFAGLAWRIPACCHQATAAVHVPLFGEVRPGKATAQGYSLSHINGILTWELASSSQHAGPGKSHHQPAFPKRNALGLAPAPQLPLSSLVPLQGWPQGPWLPAAPRWWESEGWQNRTGTSGLKPARGWFQLKVSNNFPRVPFGDSLSG